LEEWTDLPLVTPE